MNKKSVNGFAFSRKIMLASAVSGCILVSSCGGDGSPRIKDAQDKTVYEATKGTVTEVEEIEPGDDYKIIDERIIDEKEKSIAIVHTLEGTVDTLSLAKIDSGSDEAKYQRSGLRNILYYSLAASYFNRRLGNVTPNSSYYKDATAYNKSTGLKNDLKSTATSRKIKVPGASSKGYGSGKSFRSFGG
ncbi:hypothetical protein [Costertonia aggregata]|uniref:UPF0323 domain-containing protein n=1 Tax=Costertonia aggregata TaxID=343403 RepID=A0A7H9ASY6_9FLAO|nr:hypothetical protein [Costertonia aggregata]QLG46452.1 hypothetical protein HYG79_14210 [Costertonia aggregata]